MHEELFKKLLYIADQADIKITYIEGSPSDPDVAFCNQKIINMNTNFESNISVAFRIAHEISHILFSKPSFLYTFSPYVKNKEERQTNERAIHMIARLMYEDVPKDQINWLNFMNEFNLPSWFEPLVKDIIYN